MRVSLYAKMMITQDYGGNANKASYVQCIVVIKLAFASHRNGVRLRRIIIKIVACEAQVQYKSHSLEIDAHFVNSS